MILMEEGGKGIVQAQIKAVNEGMGGALKVQRSAWKKPKKGIFYWFHFDPSVEFWKLLITLNFPSGRSNDPVFLFLLAGGWAADCGVWDPEEKGRGPGWAPSLPLQTCQKLSSKLALSINCWASLAAEDNSEEKGDGPAEQNTPDLNKEPMTTPQPVRALIYGEKGDSSVVKYKITATPGYVSTSFTSSFMQLYQLIKT